MAKRGPKGSYKQDTIDQDAFEKMCAMQCTLFEIAAYLKVSEDTVQRWCVNNYNEKFAVVYEQKRSVGKVSLRRAQFKNALEGNTTMQIWLGKNMLGQRDKIDIEQNNTHSVSPEDIKLLNEYILKETK